MYRVNRLILDLDMMPADLGVMAPLLLSTFAETDFRGVDKVDVVVAVAVCCCCCCMLLFRDLTVTLLLKVTAVTARFDVW